ncbi:MAG: hypothetical protein IJ862_00425 [Selenomonadaceae bacterium]|nr:hypothetical protein [Selenomonadaceae bacterium]
MGNKTKILIWGTGKDYSPNLINLIANMLSNGSSNEVCIVGITSEDKIKGTLDGIPFIQEEDIINVDFDYLIVTSSFYYGEIVSSAVKMGNPLKKLSNKIL